MQRLKVTNSGGQLDNETWQTERKTVPLAKVQLCEYEKLLFSYAKFDCPMVCHKFPLLVTAHDYGTGLHVFNRGGL